MFHTAPNSQNFFTYFLRRDVINRERERELSPRHVERFIYLRILEVFFCFWTLCKNEIFSSKLLWTQQLSGIQLPKGKNIKRKLGNQRERKQQQSFRLGYTLRLTDKDERMHWKANKQKKGSRIGRLKINKKDRSENKQTWTDP